MAYILQIIMGAYLMSLDNQDGLQLYLSLEASLAL